MNDQTFDFEIFHWCLETVVPERCRVYKKRYQKTALKHRYHSLEDNFRPDRILFSGCKRHHTIPHKRGHLVNSSIQTMTHNQNQTMIPNFCKLMKPIRSEGKYPAVEIPSLGVNDVEEQCLCVLCTYD